MAATIHEALGSPELSSDGGRRTYVIEDASGDSEAYTTLLNFAPSSYQGFARKRLSVKPLKQTSTLDVWNGVAEYSELVDASAGDSSYSFDTSGGSQHITQSLGTIASYAATGTAPNNKGSIGVTKDSVEGVDITVPAYSWSETHYLSASYVTDRYKKLLADITGRLNTSTFRSFRSGDVLFLGARGTARGDGVWEITFNFTANPTVENLVVGDMTGISKRGWEYLWVRYADGEDQSKLVKYPLAAYVEQVYRYADFYLLGIGT